METIEIIKQALLNAYLFDIEIFSWKWMYIPLCIPAFFYMMFFLLKWSILTAPLWIPLRWAINAFHKNTTSFKNGDASKLVKKLLELIESGKL